jgi:hypothetical protein
METGIRDILVALSLTWFKWLYISNNQAMLKITIRLTDGRESLYLKKLFQQTVFSLKRAKFKSQIDK